MKNVLVTGATGFIGYELVCQLVARGLRPKVLVRRPLRGSLLAPLGVDIVQGDLERPQSLDRAMVGVDTVFHLAARAVFEEYSLVRPTIVDGSAALMAAAERAGAARFVYASSLLVYDSQSEPVDERTEARPTVGYGHAKLEAEQRLREAADEADIALGVVRLPHVYGARDLMFEQVKRGRVYHPGSGRNRFAHLHVVDAARVLIGAAETGWRGTLPVGDDLPATWLEFFAEIQKYYPRFRELGCPKWLALLGTYLITPIRRLSPEPSVYTPGAVHGWNLNLPVEKRLLWDAIGLEPKYPTIREGIPAALDECVAFQWIHPLADRAR
jgi:nucleoside-diphosphate-sugar epimerase